MTARPTLAEWIAPFVPVAEYDAAMWHAAVTTYHRRVTLPRFFAARTYLTAVGYHAATIDGCVCVLKRKWVMGNAVADLVLPPMHPADDQDAERRVARDCLAIGVGIRVSPADAVVLGLPEPRWDHREYVYTATDTTTRRSRRRHVEALRAYDAGTWHPAPIPVDGADDLVDRWGRQTDNPRRTVRDACRAWVRADAPGTCHAIATPDGRLDALSLCETLPGGDAAITVRISDRRCAIPDVGAYLHDLDIAAHTPGTRLNIGGAMRGRTAAGYKERLHPTAYIPIGRAIPTHRLTRDEWIVAKPGATPTLFA